MSGDNLTLYFGAWCDCWCSDVQPNRADIPDRCPCHGGYLLGISHIAGWASDWAKTGHSCTLAKNMGARP